MSIMLKRIATITALLAFAAAPLAFAHTDPGDSDTVPGPNPNCWSDQNPHDYGLPVSVRFDVINFLDTSIGSGRASDYNTQDCDGDGTIGDADGDREYGAGGGFFPAGPWAATCGHVSHHSGTVHVHDAVWLDNGIGFHDYVSFTVGADLTPVTPTPLINECVGDGCICPGLDPDDWLQGCMHKCTPVGSPGGDGGYWVFVNCFVETDGGWEGPLVSYVDENGNGIPDDTNGDDIPGDVQVADVVIPAFGGANCLTTGHIYFPDPWWWET